MFRPRSGFSGALGAGLRSSHARDGSEILRYNRKIYPDGAECTNSVKENDVGIVVTAARVETGYNFYDRSV